MTTEPTQPTEADTFTPMEATVFDGLIVMFDARTKAEPFGVIVDVVNADDHQMRRKPATGFVSEAIHFLLDGQQTPLAIAVGVVSVMLAIRKSASPPTMLIPPYGSVDVAVDILKKWRSGLPGLLQALSALGDFIVDDETNQRRLSRVRSQAWSANIPGIAILVDVVMEVQEP